MCVFVRCCKLHVEGLRGTRPLARPAYVAGPNEAPASVLALCPARLRTWPVAMGLHASSSMPLSGMDAIARAGRRPCVSLGGLSVHSQAFDVVRL